MTPTPPLFDRRRAAVQRPLRSAQHESLDGDLYLAVYRSCAFGTPSAWLGAVLPLVTTRDADDYDIAIAIAGSLGDCLGRET